MLGNALGPLAKTLLDTSAMMPVLKELMKFADAKSLSDIVPALAAPNGEKAPALAPKGAAHAAASQKP
jgi:hypothetical protein